jgi:hypothetical protein
MDFRVMVWRSSEAPSDVVSGRHDLQYFEMFCNVGAGKVSRFNGSINWMRVRICCEGLTDGSGVTKAYEGPTPAS